MEFFQIASILLLASAATSFPVAYTSPSQYSDLRSPSALHEPQDTNIGTAVTRGKRGYFTTAVAYPPLLTSAVAPAVPIVAPVLTSYSYFGHYAKPAVITPPIYPHGLTYYG